MFLPEKTGAIGNGIAHTKTALAGKVAKIFKIDICFVP
jgi:hypothetical protein